MHKYPKFSIIIPVKNEERILNRCLDSLQNLDYPKECLEIILADGCSQDKTREIALRYDVKIVNNIRQIVSSGRNAGFKVATGDFIAFTDADCTFDKNWLKNALKYFADKNIGGIGGKTITPASSTSFEKAISNIFYLSELLANTVHRKRISRIEETNDIPGCNAIYRKEVLAKVMPIDENLLTAEDVWMNFCVRKLGYKLLLVPDVCVTHYRRNNIVKFTRQIYRFAIGRAQIGKKNIKLLSKLHIICGLSIPIIALTSILMLHFTNITVLFSGALIFFLSIFLLSLVFTRSFTISKDMILVVTLFICSWSGGFLREMLLPINKVVRKLLS